MDDLEGLIHLTGNEITVIHNNIIGKYGGLGG